MTDRVAARTEFTAPDPVTKSCRLAASRHIVAYSMMALLCVVALGCNSDGDRAQIKSARPVTYMALERSRPPGAYLVSGAVKSWKTEQIGFEVPGRVKWVLEPGENIEGRIVDGDGNMIREGTVLAEIDDEAYTVAVDIAKAQIEIAKLEQKGIQIRLDKSLQAEIDSAEADIELAMSEFGRAEELTQNRAGSQAELDRARNILKVRQAQLKTLEANQSQAEEELNASKARLTSAELSLKDAERDLTHTKLYASYRGQISDVHVVPGSLVSSGSPVVTLQMMDPIKVEVEVSAEKSREMRRRRQLPVTYSLPDDERTQKDTNAFVYSVDTSADPTTRTFSLTLLLLNDRYQPPLPVSADAKTVGRTPDIWPLYVNRIVSAPMDVFVVEEKSILKDEEGDYVYQITNAKMGQTFPELLKVKKQRIELQPTVFSFLGIWNFRVVKLIDESVFGLETLIAGEITAPSGLAVDWEGDTIVIDTGKQWILRPGDLAYVNLSGDDLDEGYFVPINAVYEESDTAWLFAIEGDTVRKVPVEMIRLDSLANGSLVEIRSSELQDGMRIVVGGVHFLNDGERVNPVKLVDLQASTDLPTTLQPLEENAVPMTRELLGVEDAETGQ
ncbi:MAG: HlyD family efflux transporter periplasmic adaptor subunit [Rubripirellula sp.]